VHGSVHGGALATASAAAAAATSGAAAGAEIGPAGRDAVLSGMGRSVLDLLESQAPLEEFIENRYLSAERYVAFLVMFHAVAETVASFKPLAFDTSRSQSCLRVATTAAPISAADLVRTWQAGTAAGLDDESHHGGRIALGVPPPGSSSRGSSAHGGSLRRVPSLQLKPGRWRASRASLGDLLTAASTALEGSLHGSMHARGGSRISDGGAQGSMYGAANALAAMEEGGGAAVLGAVAADVPWWNAPVVSVSSGCVPPEADA
jgi:hypothetical protein